MSIETRINKIERGLAQNHNLLYQKPMLYLIHPRTGETDEQAVARHELEHNIKITNRDFTIIYTGDNQC